MIVPVLVIVYYLALPFFLPTIPIVDRLLGLDMAAGRAMVNQSFLFGYSFNFVGYIFAPFGLYILLKKNECCWFYFLLCFGGSLIPGSKSHAIFFLIQSFWLFWRFKKIPGWPLGIVAVLFVFFSIFSSYGPRHYRSDLSWTDASRIKQDEACKSGHPVECVFSYLVYRVFLVPFDVRAKWFEYFKDRPKVGWMPDEHPARSVGLWAYHSKWPEKYADKIMAYGSFDADAFARFGTKGIVIAFEILALVFVVLFLLRADAPLWGLAWVHLLYALPISSLQAIIVSQGFIFWFFIFYFERRGAKCQEPSHSKS